MEKKNFSFMAFGRAQESKEAAEIKRFNLNNKYNNNKK